MQLYNNFVEGNIPEDSKTLVEGIKAKHGFVPNLIRGLSKSTSTLKSYVELSQAFETSSFSPEEREIVLLTVSRLNECEYCTSVHSLMAEKAGLDWDTIEKIRNRESLSNPRYEALRIFTEKMTQKKGDISHDAWTAFTDAGFDQRAGLEVVMGVSLKTLTNTVNNLLTTPLDTQFEKRRWSADQARVATV